MWAPQNNKVINALSLTLFLSWLIHVSRDPFLKISESFSGPQSKAKLRSNCFKRPDLKYVFKSSQNVIISKLGDVFLLKTERDSCHPKSTQKVSDFLRNGPQISINCSGLFISLLIAVLTRRGWLTFTYPIVWLIDWLIVCLLTMWNNFEFWMIAIFVHLTS